MAYIRANNESAFRFGQWAEVQGVDMVSPPGRDPRACYRVQFSDGMMDWWPVDNAGAEYEFTGQLPGTLAKRGGELVVDFEYGTGRIALRHKHDGCFEIWQQDPDNDAVQDIIHIELEDWREFRRRFVEAFGGWA